MDKVHKPKWRKIANFPLVALATSLVSSVLLMSLCGAAVMYFAGAGEFGDTVFELVAVVALFAFYKLFLRHLGERPRDDLPSTFWGRELGKGLGVGFAIFSVTIALVTLFGGYRIIGWGGATSAFMILGSMGVGAGFIEELLFRGLLFRYLEELLGSWAALLLSAALFGLMHYPNPNATLLSTIALAVEAGIQFGGAYMLTRNLWFAIGIHAGWNVTQGLVFDVPVSGYDVDGIVKATLGANELISGGAFGVEASLISLIVGNALGLYFVWKAYKLGHIETHWWARRKIAQTKL